MRPVLTALLCSAFAFARPAAADDEIPYLLVLGIAQDGGVPQLGSERHPAWDDPSLRRTANSLALVDPATHRRWLFEATPDIRTQLRRLELAAPRANDAPLLDGIFLTHAHIGHYTGLMFLGHESLGTSGIPVHAMPRMAAFLTNNGPWSQLVRYRNIELAPLAEGTPVALSDSLTVTPFAVPHRQEFSEVVGYRIAGACASAIFIPDIDSWEELDAQGTTLESLIEANDHLLIDATFWADGELPGRDMSGFPHPRIQDTMDRLQALPSAQRGRVRFIHLNHSNPALRPDAPERAEILERGFHLAVVGERLSLGCGANGRD